MGLVTLLKMVIQFFGKMRKLKIFFAKVVKYDVIQHFLLSGGFL